MNHAPIPDQPPMEGLDGLPIALPPASSIETLSTHVSASSAVSGGTNMSPVLLTSPPGRRVGPARLARLASELSARDHRILELLLGHRFLGTTQIERFCFFDHASALSAARSSRRVLRRLDRDGLIVALGRRVGGMRPGSSSFIWQLAPAGLRLVTGRSGGRPHEPSLRFLEHCLAVADAHLAALELQHRGRIADAAVQCEPDCWRDFPGIGGERRMLKPDLFLRTITRDQHDEYEDRWFIEVDRGTESLTTLLGKCATYEAYRGSGIEQQRHGTFPLVIWQLPDQERHDRLQQAINRSLHLTPRLYRCTTPRGLPALLAGDAV